ncbi:MAG: beta-lactamase family protein [Opitutaceae bacterium]|nr:beta-lactamase family protein [Opitutaceae bacterium]
MKAWRMMHAALRLGFVGILLAWSAAVAAETNRGFDPERLGRLDALIQDHIDRGQLAGAVMYVARDGGTVRLRPYGWQDLEGGRPMRADTIFRLASMSKAVTTVAALMLYEEGRFALNDPVSRYLPAFAQPVVAVAPPAGSAPEVKYVTVPARNPITIRDLMRHTAGLTYGSGLASDDYKQAGLFGWYFADRDETIGEAVNRLARLPLHGHPGEAYQYGFATDVLGHLVEVVSGQPLDQFIESRIARPLGMKDTCFFLPPEKGGRLATVYGLRNGVLGRGDQGAYVTGPRKCFSGGAGLLATVGDYARFLQMLLNEGELEGARLLSPTTVRLMHANQAGGTFEGGRRDFGLGFWVNNHPGAYGEAIGAGAYGWGSAYFPEYLVDPHERVVAIFMAQLLPAGGLDLAHRAKNLVYQALVEPAESPPRVP